MAYHDIIWLIAVYCDILQHIEIYCGVLRYMAAIIHTFTQVTYRNGFGSKSSRLEMFKLSLLYIKNIYIQDSGRLTSQASDNFLRHLWGEKCTHIINGVGVVKISV